MPRQKFVTTTVVRFLKREAVGGQLMICAAMLALVLANGNAQSWYFHIIGMQIGGLALRTFVNDGLISLFFLLIGLEIKRELMGGELASWSARRLPAIAAFGGMLVPALLYTLINRGHGPNLSGWAIPAATDIAFALAILSLLGKKVPISLKLFLTSLAILDDLGAVVIIAVFYGGELALGPLAAAAAIMGMLTIVNLRGVTSLVVYLPLGGLLWLAIERAGIHPALAGVLLALTIPRQEVLHRLEHRLQPWVAYGVLPLFGFVNAGVVIPPVAAVFTNRLSLGVILGLTFGKPLGVFGFAQLAFRLKLAQLPSGASSTQFAAVALLCGIGFTMSLFISLLAFPANPMQQEAAKIGILAGSGLAAVAGLLVFIASSARARPMKL